ncbi:MAG: hypothetical protein WCJ64_06215, partial [Rhodospirillaceae bacterium]
HITQQTKVKRLLAGESLDGPFAEGEPSISADAVASVDYARHVLGGPFPAGEPAISADAVASVDYARHVLGGPFPAGEAAIAADAAASFKYARDVMSGRFEAGEDAISTSRELLAEYKIRQLVARGGAIEGISVNDFRLRGSKINPPQGTNKFLEAILPKAIKLRLTELGYVVDDCRWRYINSKDDAFIRVKFG